jgi:hypothetical protein
MAASQPQYVGEPRSRVFRVHLQLRQLHALRYAADQRETDAETLLNRLVATLLEEDLIKAILDD